ncbi:hypothetical protein Tco_1105175 [Tanacetum coccineum]
MEEPPELELKDLPSHLEYAYLEENDKLPVIIAKGLKDDEKDALLKVLKSHKRAIAWKITDIKGIDPRFCTLKILMEDDYKPTVQSQRRVNLKIHEVIKKEVLKLLDAGMIYPISDSLWVSPVHCVPKKGGITVVANEENELIPTRIVTGWRVCTDIAKITRKQSKPDKHEHENGKSTKEPEVSSKSFSLSAYFESSAYGLLLYAYFQNNCLPNSTIFEQLALMSPKTTAWNEFSSTMAFAIICLATNQKFNFSKLIFESMMKNLDNLSGKFLMYPRKPKIKDTQIIQSSDPSDNVADEAVHKELGNSLVRAATTASSLEAGQDSGNITKTQSKATPNESSSLETTSGGGPRCQEAMRDTIAQTRFENVSKHFNDSLLARGNTLRSDEDRLKLYELMALCTTLQNKVLDLKKTKTTQANEIASLKRRVKKLKKKDRLGEEDASKQGRIANIDANKDIYLVNVHTNEDMFRVNDLDGDEVIVDNVDFVKAVEETRSMVEEVTVVIEKAKLVNAAEETVNAAATIINTASTIPVSASAITDVEITLAQALVELKSAKLKADKVVIQEPEQGTTTTTTATIPTPGKGIVITKQELAFKLQAKKEEEERLSREKAQQIEEANIAWDDVQAKVEADYQLAQRLQAQEQEELTDEEKARLFVQFLKQRRKHFAAKRAEEKRNRPPTRAQQRSIMCTYLKNMEGWKPKSLKNKSFANIQELFEKAMKRVNTFVDYRTELVEESSKKAETEQEESSKKAEAEIAQESSSKRAGEELEQESSKKQKVEEDKESEELKQCLEIVPDDGDDVTIDATPLSIKSPTIVDYKIYQEGKKSYFQIIKVDVKARFKKTESVNYMDNLLLHHLKTMFEHHVEDNMFNDVKLQVDYECEMAFELLSLTPHQGGKARRDEKGNYHNTLTSI